MAARIHEPVFVHSTPFVDFLFLYAIALGRGRGENLDDEVGNDLDKTLEFAEQTGRAARCGDERDIRLECIAGRQIEAGARLEHHAAPGLSPVTLESTDDPDGDQAVANPSRRGHDDPP